MSCSLKPVEKSQVGKLNAKLAISVDLSARKLGIGCFKAL